MIAAALLLAAVLLAGGPWACRARSRIGADPATSVDGSTITTISSTRRHRPADEAEHLASVLDSAGRALRSGRSLTDALADTGPGPLGRLGAQVRAGSPLGLAARGVLDAAPAGGDLALSAAAVMVAVEVGGDQARALDFAAGSLRDRAAQREDRRAQSAAARLSAVVVGCLPLVVSGWLLLTDSEARAFLLTTFSGLLCATISAALQLVGWLWIRRLVRGLP